MGTAALVRWRLCQRFSLSQLLNKRGYATFTSDNELFVFAAVSVALTKVL